MNFYPKQKQVERPPLGLKPQKFWREEVTYQRILSILDAMARYADDEKACPPAWVTELSELMRVAHAQLCDKLNGD